MERIILKERQWSAMKQFYVKMNETAKHIGLGKGTNFAISHGMHHDRNYSTALDVATLTWHAMKTHQMFCSVINTKKYECSSRIIHGHVYKWENTNLMLWESSK